MITQTNNSKTKFCSQPKNMYINVKMFYRRVPCLFNTRASVSNDNKLYISIYSGDKWVTIKKKKNPVEIAFLKVNI